MIINIFNLAKVIINIIIQYYNFQDFILNNSGLVFNLKF